MKYYDYIHSLLLPMLLEDNESLQGPGPKAVFSFFSPPHIGVGRCRSCPNLGNKLLSTAQNQPLNTLVVACYKVAIPQLYFTDSKQVFTIFKPFCIFTRQSLNQKPLQFIHLTFTFAQEKVTCFTNCKANKYQQATINHPSKVQQPLLPMRTPLPRT